MIRSGDMSEAQNMIARLGKEIKSLITSALELSYFSRGAWSYEQVLLMTAGEREIALEFINARIKMASKSTQPVFI